MRPILMLKNKLINKTALLLIPSFLYVVKAGNKKEKAIFRIGYGAFAIACVPLFLVGISIHWTIYALEDLGVIKK